MGLKRARLLGRRVIGTHPVQWRELQAETGKSRTVSFYVPKEFTVIWNAFVRYTCGYREEHLSHGILRAVRLLLSQLDDTEQQRFMVAVREIAEEHSQDVLAATSLLQEILGPEENLETILHSRATGSLQRREQLYLEAVQWFNGDALPQQDSTEEEKEDE